ncbi:MAG: hypothetical protein L0Y57_01655 [Beijerinckiaceae bacterium]|nr:hypothetical protein [Beijerinckiaceae bacterium]
MAAGHIALLDMLAGMITVIIKDSLRPEFFSRLPAGFEAQLRFNCLRSQGQQTRAGGRLRDGTAFAEAKQYTWGRARLKFACRKIVTIANSFRGAWI